MPRCIELIRYFDETKYYMLDHKLCLLNQDEALNSCARNVVNVLSKCRRICYLFSNHTVKTCWIIKNHQILWETEP